MTSTYFTQDTYFLDSDQAYTTAMQRHRINTAPANTDRLQICYHDGEPLAHAPENMISVPSQDFLDFFANTRLRLPRSIAFANQIPDSEKQNIEQTFQAMLTEVQQRRQQISQHLATACQQWQPHFHPHEPLRILFIASRFSASTQYCSHSLAAAFEKMGHHSKISIEQTRLEDFTHDPSWYLRDYYDFKPHVVVNINRPPLDYSHPNVFNVSWWQDLPATQQNAPQLSWNKRDIILSTSAKIDHALKQTQNDTYHIPPIHRQHFCIDPHVFTPNAPFTRSNKIVFIGTSYQSVFDNASPQLQGVITQLMTAFTQGQPINDEYIMELAPYLDLTDRLTWHKVQQYIIGNTSVKWLCEQKDIDVEIYGEGWNDDLLTHPYYHGPLAQGAEMAEVYHQATYALSPSITLNSQRLTEMAACGCIPVVYDCRNNVEPSPWNNAGLFYRTFQQLQQCLTQTPVKNPSTIAAHHTYEKMAIHLINTIQAQLTTQDSAQSMTIKENTTPENSVNVS